MLDIFLIFCNVPRSCMSPCPYLLLILISSDGPIVSGNFPDKSKDKPRIVKVFQYDQSQLHKSQPHHLVNLRINHPIAFRSGNAFELQNIIFYFFSFFFFNLSPTFSEFGSTLSIVSVPTSYHEALLDPHPLQCMYSQV